MKAIVLNILNPLPLTQPFPDKTGLHLSLRGGDVVYPRGPGNWFAAPYFDPAKVIHFFLRWPLIPFVSWRIGKRGGYIGAKGFGVDSDAYKNWLPPAEVYPGSQAVMLISVRPFATLD